MCRPRQARCTRPAALDPELLLGCPRTPACRYYEHLGSRLPVVVVSDSLAQQFGGDSGRGGGSLSGLAAHDQQPPPQQQVATAAPQLGRAREDEDEDPELDALLRQMHVGAPAASGGAGDNIASLLDSLGIGGDEPGGAEAAPLCQLSGQPEQLPPPEQTPGAAAASKAPLLLDPGVHILSAADYFGGCWGHVPAVVDVFESIQQQSKAGEAASSGAGGGGAFRPHLSAAAMEAGLAAGALLAGTLSASRRVRGEASVAVGGGRVLVVAGWAAMNRAVHGDRVAVRLLPREQWHTIGAAGPGGSGAGGGADGDGGGAEEEEVEEEEEHDLLAATGAGEADVAADEAHGGGDELADPLVGTRAGLATGPAAVGLVSGWTQGVAAKGGAAGQPLRRCPSHVAPAAGRAAGRRRSRRRQRRRRPAADGRGCGHSAALVRGGGGLHIRRRRAGPCRQAGQRQAGAAWAVGDAFVVGAGGRHGMVKGGAGMYACCM